ncbi:helix-turn-helix domain-containing protein [Streptomyces sp. NPDC059166]|uniref:helix-turn-helix domain-containing protein n=1 Tax=Streptomyces sp. NPDC059166 TaxID=3346752 RepID=UPI0036861BA3
MDTQQVNARPRAESRKAPENRPTSGVIHDNTRHSAAFTVVGNHLCQHRALSLLAIGLAVHIQSLPTGARIGIKHLAARFPESEVRIAAALRELEATGYLRRSRTRLPDGRVVTRTVSCNQPGTPAVSGRPRHTRREAAATAPATSAPETLAPPAAPPSLQGAPAAPPWFPAQPSAPTPMVEPPQAPPPAPAPVPIPSTPAHVPAPAASVHVPAPAAPVRVPTPTARIAPPPPLPRPLADDADRDRLAKALLGDLRRVSPQLTLTEEGIASLAPGVATWLERDAHPDAIRQALTSDLPVPVKHPAKLLRHRITALLPPPLPGAQDLVPTRPARIVIPLQNCDRCDRAFRSRRPGHCRDCRADALPAA